MFRKRIEKLKQLARNLLLQGLSPRRLAATTAAGLTIGIHPIYGITTASCALVATCFRLNHPWIQAMNYSMTLVKPLLIFPFLRFGEWLFQAEPFGLSLTELSALFAADPLDTLRTFAWTFIHAFVGWMVWAPFVGVMIYFIALSVIKRSSAMRRQEAVDQ